MHYNFYEIRPSFHLLHPFPTSRNSPLSLKPPPLLGTRAEYTEQSGLHPLQMCTLRASKQRPAFFKHFQGHLYFFTRNTDTICLIDRRSRNQREGGERGGGGALRGGFLSTCEGDRMKRCLCDALRARSHQSGPLTPGMREGQPPTDCILKQMQCFWLLHCTAYSEEDLRLSSERMRNHPVVQST